VQLEQMIVEVVEVERCTLPVHARTSGLDFHTEPAQARFAFCELLGPKFSAKERSRMNLRRFYAISQIEYCRNFIFKRHFPIHKIFERSCELGLWRLSADKISEIFGTRVSKRLKGKLNTTLEHIEHGHHIFRAYCKHAFLTCNEIELRGRS